VIGPRPVYNLTQHIEKVKVFSNGWLYPISLLTQRGRISANCQGIIIGNYHIKAGYGAHYYQ